MPMDAAVMAKGIEIVFHVVAFLLAIGVLAMICIQAQSIGRSNQTLLTAPSSLQAGYIGLLILYMIYPVFKNQGFRVANADVESVEVVVILLMILIYFKLTVFKDINTTNLAALTIIDGVQSMNTSTAHDLHVHRRQPHESAYVATTDPQGLKGAFSLSFWIGIDPATLTGVYGALAAYATNTSKAGPQLLSEDKKSYRVKVPIFIRGIPKYWLVANGLNPELDDDSAVALVKCPIIWLVIGVDATTTTPLAPFFEVEFNHMDIPSDVLIVPNTCYVHVHRQVHLLREQPGHGRARPAEAGQPAGRQRDAPGHVCVPGGLRELQHIVHEERPVHQGVHLHRRLQLEAGVLLQGPDAAQQQQGDGAALRAAGLPAAGRLGHRIKSGGVPSKIPHRHVAGGGRGLAEEHRPRRARRVRQQQAAERGAEDARQHRPCPHDAVAFLGAL